MSENNGNRIWRKDPSFWNTRFRLIQPNLRKIDAKGLDVRALMDEIAAWGANAVLVNGGGIVAWYPTDHPHQAVNEYLETDFVAEAVEAAHERGMRVLVRMDVSKSYPQLLERHPDWFRRDAEGRVATHWEMLTTCPTGPFWEDYNFRVVEELLGRYPDIDGIFYNAFGYLRCYCDRCKRLFKEATGHELPLREDWDDPAWRAFVRYRYDRHADYNRRLAEFIDRVSPGTVLTIDTHVTLDSSAFIRESGWYTPQFASANACITSEAFNFLDRPYPRWVYWAGEETKIGGHIAQTCIILSYSKTIYSRRAAQPAPQIGYDLMQIAANGGSPAVAFSGMFDQDDRQSLPMIRRVYTFLRDHEDEYAAMKPLADVAIVYSQRTADVYGRERPAERWQDHYRGMYEMLAHSHIPFTVLHEGSVTLEKLKTFKCVLLPNIAAMTDEEAALFDRYVEEGGHLICTFETGRYDETGRERPEPALRCIGRTVTGKLDDPYSYLVMRDKRWLEEYPETDLLLFTGPFLATAPRPDAAGPLAEDLFGVPSVRNTTPEFAYWEKTEDLPGLTIHACGRGTAAYLPWGPDKLYRDLGVPECRSLVAGLVKRAAGELTAACDAPREVELQIAARGEGGYLIHLLNGVGARGGPLTETVPVSGVSVRVRGAVRSARSLVTGEACPVETDGEASVITVPRLELFDAIITE